MNWTVLVDLAAMLAAGLLGVFGLVAYANSKGVRLRALPRGTRRVTQAELDEANDRAWREAVARKAVAMSGGGR